MPKKIKLNNDLPANLHFKSGTYYYVSTTEDKKRKWMAVGKFKGKAVEIANKLNNLNLEEKERIRIKHRNILKQVENFIFKRDKNKCTYCGSEKDLGIDHVIPFSEGGSNRAFNLVLCCWNCNISKSNKNPILFMVRRTGFFDDLMYRLIDMCRNL